MSPHDIAYVALRSLLGFGALVLAAVVLWRAVRGRLLRGRLLFLFGAVLMAAIAAMSAWDALAIGVRRPAPPDPLSWAWILLFDAPILLWFGLALYQADRRALAEAELHRIATHDPLTGCLNRRGLAEAAARLLADARRTRRPAGVLALDLDRFKALNDRDGHAAGDAALRQVGETTRSVLRASDLVARIGGDEFIIVLEGSDRHTTAETARRLLDTLGAALAPTGIGVSIGTAVLRGREDLDAAIARADAALYRAKQEGRGRVVEGIEAIGALREAG